LDSRSRKRAVRSNGSLDLKRGKREKYHGPESGGKGKERCTFLPRKEKKRETGDTSVGNSEPHFPVKKRKGK